MPPGMPGNGGRGVTAFLVSIIKVSLSVLHPPGNRSEDRSRRRRLPVVSAWRCLHRRLSERSAALAGSPPCGVGPSSDDEPIGHGRRSSTLGRWEEASGGDLDAGVWAGNSHVSAPSTRRRNRDGSSP